MLVMVKSAVEIPQNFVAFSEYLKFMKSNFNISQIAMYFYGLLLIRLTQSFNNSKIIFD